jgi:class 3 adenylate cyclase/tetratricopeptide (TPR) repeat protein
MHRVVPQIIIDNFRAGRFKGEFPAVGLFLDLSGFSTMTDVLMQHGQHGAEVLAGLMHGVFDPLVEGIFHYGGKVIGFAGDGVMALFPVEANAKDVVLRALAAAWDVQQRLAENPARQTLYGKFHFTVKVGIALGDVTWGILHSQDDRNATYFFRGSAVDDSAKAEQSAEAGEIRLPAETFSLVRDAIWAQPAGSFRRFDGFRHGAPTPHPTILPPVDLETSRAFFPAEIVAQDMRGEFRQVVNLFMRFPDMPHENLDPFFQVVFALKAKYGGLLNRLDFGDKGCNMLVLWGAPTAYENDISRALSFILELQSKVDFPITAGVTYYVAHAGYLGGVMSEDYTCYGWGVNLAARFMMSASPGQVWVDDRIARRVSSRFEIESVGVQKFKGFAADQQVNILRGFKHDARTIYQGEMIGREDHVKELERFVQPLWRGEFAGVVLLLGEAGIGKGRLVHEFHSVIVRKRPHILWALWQSDENLRQSFNPIRRWLMRYFDMESAETAARRQIFDAKLQSLIDSTPDQSLAIELDRLRSVLAALVDLYWDDSLFEQLDAQSRYNSTILALIVLIEAESSRQPVILFVDDAHDLDDDTIRFLSRLKRALRSNAHPVAILVTSRSRQNWFTEDGFVDHSILLAGLSAQQVARHLEVLLGGAASQELVRFVLERSEGNPYFVEQIVRYLREENLIEMSREGWAQGSRLRDVILPGDIRALLVARLDQLKLEVKDIVHTASVLGREFDVDVLTMMSGGSTSAGDLIAEAERHAIWAGQEGGRYVFTHALLRDAAYSMQMRARLQELHRIALNALEKYYAEDLPFHYPELAYHAECGELKSKAQELYKLAGKTSADAYQNSQAIDFYSRAYSFTPFDDLQTQFKILTERVALYNRIGDRRSQAQDLDSMEKLALQLRDDRLLARARGSYAHFCFTTGDYASTIRVAEEAIALARKLDDVESVLEVYVLWSAANFRLGKIEEAIRLAREALTLARNSGKREDEGSALSSLGLMMLESKEPSLAIGYMEESLVIAREVNNRTMQARCLANLANAAVYVLRDYELARSYYEQAHKLNIELGDRYADGIALGNIGWVCAMLGDYAGAQKHQEQALALAREVGNVYIEIITLMNLSGVAEAQGKAEEALVNAVQANELARQKSDQPSEAWSYLYLGYAYLADERLAESRAAFEQALRMRRELGQPPLANEPLAGLVQVALKSNDPVLAASYTEEILAYLENGGTLDGTEEPLRVYLACHQFLKQIQDPRADHVLSVARELLNLQVMKISNEKTRRAFVENVPWRREIAHLPIADRNGS